MKVIYFPNGYLLCQIFKSQLKIKLMNELEAEKMETIEGGYPCDAVLRTIFTCTQFDQGFLIDQWFANGCHLQ
jgi:hypothetical protein